MRPLVARKALQERLGHVEDAGEVDGDDVLPVLDHGVGGAEHAVAPRDAGIVDQDRHRPDLLGDAPGDGDAILGLGDVERKTRRRPAGIADLLCRLFGGLAVDVEQHHLGALAGIAERNRAPDAGACAGDNRDVILEKAGHGYFLCFGFGLPHNLIQNRRIGNAKRTPALA